MKLAMTEPSATAESAPLPTAPANVPCPKCGNALIDPRSLGWCKACGYCKSLANFDAESSFAETRAGSLGGVVEAGGAITRLPLWFWTSLLCVAIGIFLAIVMDRRLPAGDNLQRATWASVQVAAGALMVFIAQCFALMTIAHEEPTLSFKDALFPFRLWGLVIKRLPKLKVCLWIALLGLSLSVGGAVFIGGFQHWFGYLPKSAVQLEKERIRGSEFSKGAAVIVPVD